MRAIFLVRKDRLLRHGANRLDHLAAHRILEQVSLGSGLERPQHVALVGVHAEDDDPGARVPRQNAARRLHPVHVRHGQIQ